VSLSLSLSRLSPLEAFGPVPNSYQSDPSPASEIRGGLTSIRQNDPIRVGDEMSFVSTVSRTYVHRVPDDLRWSGSPDRHPRHRAQQESN